MKRSIPWFVAAVLFGVAGIYSLFADNNGIPVARDEFVDALPYTQSQPVNQEFDAGNRRPRVSDVPANINRNTLRQNRQPAVSEKQKRKYRIQITYDQSPKVHSAVQENGRLVSDYVLQSPADKNLAPATENFFADEPAAPVWLYCDEIELKTAKQTDAGKSSGYDLKIAGPFVVESPGLSIRGMGLQVQDGEMSFTNGNISSGGFILAVEKCKLPFAIRSLQIDSADQKRNPAVAPIATY